MQEEYSIPFCFVDEIDSQYFILFISYNIYSDSVNHIIQSIVLCKESGITICDFSQLTRLSSLYYHSLHEICATTVLTGNRSIALESIHLTTYQIVTMNFVFYILSQ